MTRDERIQKRKADKEYGESGWHYADECDDDKCTLVHIHASINCQCADCCAEFDYDY